MQEHDGSNFKELFASEPALLEYLEFHFPDSGDERLRSLLDKADSSSFMLLDWVAALRVVSQWLEQRDLRLPIEDSIEYVSCAAESVGNTSLLNKLPEVVADFLKHYGCESAIKENN